MVHVANISQRLGQPASPGDIEKALAGMKVNENVVETFQEIRAHLAENGVDIEKTPLFLSEVRRSARLNDIQNVAVEIPTPFHYWLNFGNVQMETAGKEGTLTFNKVPGPREVAAEINRRIDAFRRNEEVNAARKRAQELPDWFEMYNRLDPDKQEWVRTAVNNPLKPNSP